MSSSRARVANWRPAAFALRAAHLIGRKALVWLGIGAVAGIALSILETQLAAFIQMFLKTLGISSDVSPPRFSLLPDSADLRTTLVCLGVIGVLKAGITFTVSQAACVALDTINARLRLLALHDLLLSQSGRYVSAGDTNTRFGEIFPKTAYFFYYAALCIPQCLLAVILGVILFLTSPKSALVGFAGLLIMGLAQIKVMKSIRRVASSVPEEQRLLVAGVERVTRNWLLVRALRTNKREFGHLSANVMNCASHSIRTNALTNLGSSAPQAVGVLLLIGIVLLDVTYFGTPGLVIISFLYMFLRLVQTLAIIANYFGAISTFMPHAKLTARYFETFAPDETAYVATLTSRLAGFGATTRLVDTGPERVEPSKASLIAPGVRLEGVTFRYAGAVDPVFSSLSFSVRAGEQLGIVGRSGSGKSTLLALILGILRPERGDVLVGDVDAETYIGRHTDRIGFVGAEPFLIAGSIKDNLDYGSRRSYVESEYKAALEGASLLSFVEAKPEGLSYRIEENAGSLSAGQKQRLAIARALLRAPMLLVMDEVTANLDAMTEAEITATVKDLKGKATVIIVSHRKEALQYCDRIVEI